MKINVLDFLNKVMHKTLIRDEKTHEYTLQDKELDRVFGLPNERTIYTPNSEDVESFANVSFILALLGIKATNFTAVSNGYLLTCEDKDAMHYTFYVNKSTEEYNRSFLIGIASEIAKKTQSEFHLLILGALIEKKSFREICAEFGDFQNDETLSPSDKKRIDAAILEFSGDSKNHPNSLNNQNCNNNHKILLSVCCHSLGINEETATKEEMDVALELYEKTLYDWILPGYKAFRGKTMNNEDVEQYGKILNDRALEVLERFKDKRDASAALNMCSTDYTADIAYAIMTIYAKGQDKEQTFKEVEQVNPKTPNNGKDRDVARQLAKDYLNSLNK